MEGRTQPDGLAELLERAAAPGREAEQAARELALRAEKDPATDALRSVGFDPVPALPQRLELYRRTASLCPELMIEVAGLRVRVRLGRGELWRFYLPLCQAMARLVGEAEGRVLVGIAGTGASGKTTFSLLLQLLLERGLPGHFAHVPICSMDGFHYSNAYLATHFMVDEQGEQVPLRALKGAPVSYDGDGFVASLVKLRTAKRTSFPRYDRRLHDPVPGAVRIGPQDRLVLVEGNYLLLEEDPWAAVAELLDLSLFLLQTPEVVREGMISRHIAGGRTEAEAVAHYERVDRKNFELIMASAHRADLWVRRAADHQVTAIQRPGAARGG